jgi:hypothetical protein
VEKETPLLYHKPCSPEEKFDILSLELAFSEQENTRLQKREQGKNRLANSQIRELSFEKYQIIISA